MSTTDVDVIVVGGGPVGVMTALLLAQRGFSVRVLERAPEVYDLPRAIVMDDEIQRVFQNAGLLDELAPSRLRCRAPSSCAPTVSGSSAPNSRSRMPIGRSGCTLDHLLPTRTGSIPARRRGAQRGRPETRCRGLVGRAGPRMASRCSPTPARRAPAGSSPPTARRAASASSSGWRSSTRATTRTGWSSTSGCDDRYRRSPASSSRSATRFGRPPTSWATPTTDAGSSSSSRARPVRRWSSRPACGSCSRGG